MFSPPGLSLQQAPPITIPVRFFLSAPLFAVVAALLLLTNGPLALVSRWTSPVLAITHLLVLGYITMVMIGAMLQMLPVMAGAPVPRVVLVGSTVHTALLMGTALLAISFFTNSTAGFLIAGVVLSVGMILFISAASLALVRAEEKDPPDVLRGMKLSVVALTITIGLGLLLVGDYTEVLPFSLHSRWTNLHITWGIGGWVALLFIAVSYRLTPMFMVTPEYPDSIRRWFAIGLFGLLFLWTLLQVSGMFEVRLVYLEKAVYLLWLFGVGLFIVATLVLQAKRKRKVPDNTLLFWRLAFALALLVLPLILIGKKFVPAQFNLLVGFILIPGIAMSLINGMLYRIVPFLSWFHLQHMQLTLGRYDLQLPHMKSFISDRAARLQFGMHCLAIAAGVLAVFKPSPWVYPAAILFIASNLFLFWNLLSCMLRYTVVLRQFRQQGSNQNMDLHLSH